MKKKCDIYAKTYLMAKVFLKRSLSNISNIRILSKYNTQTAGDKVAQKAEEVAQRAGDKVAQRAGDKVAQKADEVALRAGDKVAQKADDEVAQKAV